MTTKTYLFYDLETTGTNKCFDQVLQFAAIRTDLALNELERHDIQIKLNADVIPNPEALLVHRIPISAMLSGEPEITAIQKIHGLLNTPGTISCGYNTLNFDDEFLRFSFHRNLLSPYTHQWANDCGRMDIYPMAVLYFLYKNDIIQWPEIDGKISLKLEQLSALNDLATGNAHTAIVDVEATVALARLFFKDRKMWDYAIAYFDKNQDIARMKNLERVMQTGKDVHQLGLFIGETGFRDLYQFPALSLGQHHHYKNQTLWLRLDKTELSQTTLDNVAQTTWVVKKRPADLGFLLPYSGRFIKHLTDERLKLCEENLTWLKSNLSIFNEIKAYHQEYTYPDVPNLDVDAALYQQGFLTPAEQSLAVRFHQVSEDKKMQIVRQFQNSVLQEMAVRLMGRHYPAYLDEVGKKVFAERLENIYQSEDAYAPIDYRGQRQMTAPGALKKIDELLQNPQLETLKRDLLSELKVYLTLALVS